MTTEKTTEQATGQHEDETASQKCGFKEMMMRMCCGPSADRESSENQDNASGCCCGPFRR